MQSVDHEQRIREIERRAFVRAAAAQTLAIRGYALSAEELTTFEEEAAQLYPELSVETGAAA